MIPYKLRLQNFLSYGDGLEPLDFSGMHLVCLVGQNGHGKSALLDAVTWALWGKARGSSDDDLVRAGSSEMQVEFEFGLEGRRYNVTRKRLRSGRGKSELELAVWNEAQAAWLPLTEPSIRATQTRIDDVLRMDYRTFTNSAFLKQGEADAFTSKPAGERKDILATILNLAKYDAYAERAKELAKQAEGTAQVIQQGLQEIENEIAKKPEYEAQVQSGTVSEMQARLRRQDAEQSLAAVRLEVQELTAKEAAHQDLEKRTAQDRRNHEETAAQWQAAQTRLTENEALLAEREKIETSFAALQAARAEETDWSERLRARRPLEVQEQELQRQVTNARHQIEGELALVRKDLSEAQTRAQAMPDLENKRTATASEIAQLEARQSQSQIRRERLAALAGERQRLDADKQTTEKEGITLKERLTMLRTGETATCPVCKQALGGDGQQHLETEYEQQMEDLRVRVRANLDTLKALAAEERELQTSLQADERELRRLGSLQRQQAEIESALAQAQAAAETLPALQAQAAELAQTLQDEKYAAAAQASLAEIAAQMARLAYDAEAHENARAVVSELAGIERQHIAVEEALKQADPLRAQVEQLQARWQREEDRLAADRTRLQELQAEITALPAARQRAENLAHEATQTRAAWEQAQARLVAAQQRLQACESLESARKERLNELLGIRAKASRYRQLQEAFGPRGVQAMIIEAALPEVENEANTLLGRLTDGRMNVRIATQRDLRSGGTRETLDIIISDELGSRPYELYSGGEAFRADLAIRIALSRLLARRAGAALQTLFIDEGFGTQDTHGREGLVDALHAIKDDFALVLVITHIDELKEQFPVRIQVVKEESGSRYAVV